MFVDPFDLETKQRKNETPLVKSHLTRIKWFPHLNSSDTFSDFSKMLEFQKINFLFKAKIVVPDEKNFFVRLEETNVFKLFSFFLRFVHKSLNPSMEASFSSRMLNDVL